MNYTKGKWEATTYGTIRIDFDGNNGCLLFGDNQEANARLIAKAPEMYEMPNRTECIALVSATGTA